MCLDKLILASRPVQNPAAEWFICHRALSNYVPILTQPNIPSCGFFLEFICYQYFLFLHERRIVFRKMAIFVVAIAVGSLTANAEAKTFFKKKNSCGGCGGACRQQVAVEPLTVAPSL